MCAFMAPGVFVTYYMVPKTRDEHGKERTLEQLAEGRVLLKRLNIKNGKRDRGI